VAHELNQPLAALLTTAQACQRLAQRSTMKPKDLYEGIDNVVRLVQWIGDLLDRLRRFAMGVQLQRASCPFAEIVRQALAVLTPELTAQKAELRLQISPTLPVVDVDAVQIGQVLVNLVKNALEALASTPLDQRIVTLSAQAVEDREVEVAISDQGTGISVEMIDRLFQPFLTTKPRGMGLGLALSRSIVQAHGGRLWVKPNSSPNRGCTFFFTIPLGRRNHE